MFAFDELTTLKNTRDYQERSVRRTQAWAERCLAEHGRLTEQRLDRPYQALFGVVQGAQYEDLRRSASGGPGRADGGGTPVRRVRHRWRPWRRRTWAP
jgi:queuine tRNA-ribosyltransferase